MRALVIARCSSEGAIISVVAGSLLGPYREESLMSIDQVRRANLAAIQCEPRPQLPSGFRRSSTRVGGSLGAARTGLSVYELPPGQAIGPYHYEDPEEEWLLVVSGTPTLRHPGGEDQLEPRRSSALAAGLFALAQTDRPADLLLRKIPYQVGGCCGSARRLSSGRPSP